MAQPTDAPRRAPSTPTPPEDPPPAVRHAVSDDARPDVRRTINAFLGR